MSHRLSTLVFLCLTAAALTAQRDADPQRPTFIGITQSVRVDVYVTRNGEPVADLRPDEIQLLEDNAPQTIQTFERVAFNTPGPAPEAPRTLDRSRQMAADPRARLFVVFLDTRHTSYVGDRGPHTQVRFPLFDVLDRHLGANDLIALATPEARPEDLTFDRGVAGLARLEGTWKTSTLNPDPGMLRDPKVDMYEACYPRGPQSPLVEMTARHFERQALDALDGLVTHLGALRDERKSVVVVTDGWPLFTENPGLLDRGRPGALRPGSGEPRLPRPPIGGRGRDDVGAITERGPITMSDATYRACEADLLALASVDHPARLREIVARANQNNVSFYPVSSTGLTTSSGGPAVAQAGAPFQNQSVLDRQTELWALADETGGIAVVNTNTLEAHVRRIMATTSAYYLLGYTSSNGTADGRYRRIAVRVSRPGVEVHARPGYFAIRPPETRTTPEPKRDAGVAAALSRLESAVRNPGAPATGDPTFSRTTSAVAPFVAAPDRRFRRSERLRVEVRAAGAAGASARLLDRTGKPIAVPATVTTRPDASGAFQWVVVDVTLAPLAQADYLVEVASGDALQLAAFRIVP